MWWRAGANEPARSSIDLSLTGISRVVREHTWISKGKPGRGSRAPMTERIRFVKRTAPVLAILAMLIAPSLAAAEPSRATAEAAGPGTAILVRHAETDLSSDGPRNPHLSERGRTRAEALAAIFGEAGITSIYSTPYHRTMETARPLAETLGLEVRTYDPRQLEELARDIESTSGRLVVVGHSNTTPELVQLLGGDGGDPIDESEYDRIYILVRTGQAVETIRLHYGNLFSCH